MNSWNSCKKIYIYYRFRSRH